MTDQTDPSKSAASVTDLINRLEHPLKPEIEALRGIILGANSRIREEIKWNSPSFYTSEHFATFNLHKKNLILIIFHRGAKKGTPGPEAGNIPDPHGLIEWLDKDRGAVKFTNMADVQSKRDALVELVNQWIQTI